MQITTNPRNSSSYNLAQHGGIQKTTIEQDYAKKNMER